MEQKMSDIDQTALIESQAATATAALLTWAHEYIDLQPKWDGLDASAKDDLATHMVTQLVLQLA
jgi:hypothetical protein